MNPIGFASVIVLQIYLMRFTDRFIRIQQPLKGRHIKLSKGIPNKAIELIILFVCLRYIVIAIPGKMFLLTFLSRAMTPTSIS